MARRPVAVVAAIVLFLEAFGIVLINVTLGKIVDNQSMSLAGLDPGVMSGSTLAMGAVAGLYLVGCAVVLALAGIRDRAPGRFGRVLLISCAILHGVLGALTVGLVGWSAFGFMMVVLALIVLTLVAFGKREAAGAEGAGEPAGAAPGEDGGPGGGSGAPATV